jgi:hypothetical protein
MPDSPIGLFFERTQKVFLVTFSGAFTRDTALALNEAARAVVDRHGHVPVILDFTGVTSFSIQLRDWPELGNERRAIRGKPRFLVAPPTEIFSILRLHGTHRGGHGDDTEAVPTRDAACRKLGLSNPNFEPLVLDPS